VAADDTRLHKTGRHIQSAFYQRDPLSPKFRFNLMFGLRFLQMSLLVPLYRHQKAAPRGLPVRFEEVPAVKRPRRKAQKAAWREYRQAVKQRNLSQRHPGDPRITCFAGCGRSPSQTPARRRRRQFLQSHPVQSGKADRVEIIARARRDFKLCRRAASSSRRFCDSVRFTPDEVRLDPARHWKKARIFYGDQWRKIRYKEVTQLYWRTASRKRPLRLFVVEGVLYYSSRRTRRRDPAFLLTTDLHGTARELLQAYFDRWQIEVNHREEKDTLGVGQAQLRSIRSVPRQPAFAVAAYSALLLAGLLAFGPTRNSQHYEALPKWRRNASRPSCLDLITLLRKEIAANPALVQPFGLQLDWKSLGLAAAA